MLSFSEEKNPQKICVCVSLLSTMVLTDNIHDVDNGDCKILVLKQIGKFFERASSKNKVFKFESSTENRIFISELLGLAWALNLKGLLCFKSAFSRQVSVLLQEVARKSHPAVETHNNNLFVLLQFQARARAMGYFSNLFAK